MVQGGVRKFFGIGNRWSYPGLGVEGTMRLIGLYCWRVWGALQTAGESAPAPFDKLRAGSTGLVRLWNLSPGLTSLCENEQNPDFCAGAGAHRRSLGYARDDNLEAVTFIRGR